MGFEREFGRSIVDIMDGVSIKQAELGTVYCDAFEFHKAGMVDFESEAESNPSSADPTKPCIGIQVIVDVLSRESGQRMMRGPCRRCRASMVFATKK